MRLNRTRLAIKHLLSKVSVVYESKYIQSTRFPPLLLRSFSLPASFSRFFLGRGEQGYVAVINRVRVGIPSTQRATCCSVPTYTREKTASNDPLFSFLRSALFQPLSLPRSVCLPLYLIISSSDFVFLFAFCHAQFQARPPISPFHLFTVFHCGTRVIY